MRRGRALGALLQGRRSALRSDLWPSLPYAASRREAE